MSDDRHSATRKDIRTAELEDIAAFCQSQGWQNYRIRQIHDWVWKKGATSFADMSNLSKDMRVALDAHWMFRAVNVELIQRSTDGTIKYRLKLHDGYKVESVLIPVSKENRYTICVSSQVGCSLSCAFCATGKMKRMRNLDPAEIYDQVVLVNESCREEYDHPLTNIVYMGMGEPLLNYQNVLKSTERITSPDGLGMSPRRITVSTAGIAKAIKRLADDKVRFNLALSLHAAEDEKRNRIMPINEQNNLSSLMEALHYFAQNTRGRISYEYIAFDGFNDSLEDADKLVALCKDFPVRVNIIEYNPVEGVRFRKSKVDRIDEFALRLRSKGVTVTVRRSRGKDIDAACGQLANK